MATGRVEFERVFNLTSAALMVLDRDLRYVAVNAEYQRVTGTRRADLLGRNLFDLFPHDPDDPGNVPAQMLRRSLERVLSTGAADHLAAIPYRVPHEVDGRLVTEERVWSATHTPLLDDDGKVAFILQHTSDVTGLQGSGRAAQETLSASVVQAEAGVVKRALAVQAEKERLDEERALLRSLFEGAPGFMCFLEGRDHVFALANAAYLMLVGKSSVVGKPVREALPEVVEQGFVALLDQVFSTGTPYVGRGIRVLLAREGAPTPEEAFVDFIYQPVRGADGAVQGIFVQGHDITERKRAEEAREAALRTAEALATELAEQSAEVREALVRAQARIEALEAALAGAKG